MPSLVERRIKGTLLFVSGVVTATWVILVVADPFQDRNASSVMPTMPFFFANPFSSKPTYSWEVRRGYISGEVADATNVRADVTVDEAKQVCISVPECQAFTYRGQPEGTVGAPERHSAIFKRSGAVSGNTDWTTYVKIEEVPPPQVIPALVQAMASAGTPCYTGSGEHPLVTLLMPTRDRKALQKLSLEW